MPNVVLSIKSKYVEAIKSGQKRYEFRKVLFTPVEKVWIYASSPVKKIVGCFNCGIITSDTPQMLWKKFSDHAGISETEFFKYFENKNRGYAIEIMNFLEIYPIAPNNIYLEFTPPQSFCYINSDINFDITDSEDPAYSERFSDWAYGCVYLYNHPLKSYSCSNPYHDGDYWDNSDIPELSKNAKIKKCLGCECPIVEEFHEYLKENFA